MRPTTTEEYRQLALAFGATCTKGSMMLSISRLVSKLSNGEEIPLLAATLPAIKPLVQAAMQEEGKLTLEILCEHFASVEHFNYIMKNGTTIGNEIEVSPKELRPILHTLLPLDDDGIYQNAGVKLEILNLIEFGNPQGDGFWAAHMAGKIWIPRPDEYRRKLLEMQGSVPEFVSALRSVAYEHPVVDYCEYKRLTAQTHEAKREIAKTGR